MRQYKAASHTIRASIGSVKTYQSKRYSALWINCGLHSTYCFQQTHQSGFLKFKALISSFSDISNARWCLRGISHSSLTIEFNCRRASDSLLHYAVGVRYQKRYPPFSLIALQLDWRPVSWRSNEDWTISYFGFSCGLPPCIKYPDMSIPDSGQSHEARRATLQNQTVEA